MSSLISSNFTRNSGRFPVSTFVCTFCWFTRTLALFSRVGHKKFPLRTRLLVNVINLVGNGNRLNGQKNHQRVAFGLVLMKTTRTLKNGGKICPSSVNIERNKTKNNYFRCPFVDVRCVNRKVSGCRRESASQVKVDGTFFIRREMFLNDMLAHIPAETWIWLFFFFLVCTGSRWRVKELTYTISKYPSGLRQPDVDRELSRAFQVWADVTELTFEHRKSGKVHIEIR